MLSQKELKRLAAERKKKAAKAKEKSDKFWEDFRKEMLEKHSKRVESLLDGELGNFIKRADANGIKKVQLEEFRCWKINDKDAIWPRNDMYDDFDLGFNPKPNYPPTKRLINLLRRQGFSAKIVTKLEPIYSYDYEGSPERVIGNEDKHYLEISWE